MDYLFIFIFIFQAWIIVGIAFLVFEILDGSGIFFLPLGLSSFVTSSYVFALKNMFLPSIIFFDKWYEILLLWALLGLLIYFLSYQKFLFGNYLFNL